AVGGGGELFRGAAVVRGGRDGRAQVVQGEVELRLGREVFDVDAADLVPQRDGGLDVGGLGGVVEEGFPARADVGLEGGPEPLHAGVLGHLAPRRGGERR